MRLEKGDSIQFHRGACLNCLQNQVTCQVCAEHCPTSALKLQNNQVVYDRDVCSGCGVCLAWCPTGSFQSDVWNEANVVRTVCQSEAEEIDLFCGHVEDPYIRTSKEKNHACFKILTCLGALSRTAIFEMAREKKLHFHMEECADCPYRKNAELLERNVGLAQELLQSCGKEAVVDYVREKDGEVFFRKQRALVTGEKYMSRRDFILQLRNKSLNHMAPMLFPAEKKATLEMRKGENTYLVPSWSVRLKQCYLPTKEQFGGGEPTEWPDIVIQDNCKTCGTCTYFCPTGALRGQFREKDGKKEYIIHFEAGTCADCRLCEMLCTNKAIIRSRKPKENPYQRWIIRKVNITPCKKCGAMSPISEDRLCHWCRTEPKIDGVLDQVKKAVFKKKE